MRNHSLSIFSMILGTPCIWKNEKKKRYIRYFDSEGKKNILHIFYICMRYMHTVELRLYELYLHIRKKF